MNSRKKKSTEVRQRSEAGEAIRRKIKALATEMFIVRGYNGVTFLDIAKTLDINHSLVHYHFGSKAKLSEEVLLDFVDSGLREVRALWCASDKSLFQKFVEARDRLYRQFCRYHADGHPTHPTGLVSRFAMEYEAIDPKLREIVNDTHERIDNCVRQAVLIAIERGELAEDAPVQLLGLQVSCILFSAGPTARYGWDFSRLDDLFRGTFTMIKLAYGKSAPEPWPKVKRPRIRRAAAGKSETVAA